MTGISHNITDLTQLTDTTGATDDCFVWPVFAPGQYGELTRKRDYFTQI